MKISLQILKQILSDAEFHDVQGDEEFEICDIAYLKDFDKFPLGVKILYFLVYEDNPEILGWYNKPFDRSRNLARLREFKNLVFVADSRVNDEQLSGCPHIRVNNIYQTIDVIRRHILSGASPTVVGMTGSVGKTTGTALVESILSQKFSCGRIYSKRLTPLTLSSWLVNFLLPSHQILALEYSMYRKHHIGNLIELLRPNISVFLNIKNVHLGVEGINTLQDILEGKAPLVKRSDLGILNADNPLILSLKRKDDLIFSCENSKADAFVRSDGIFSYLYLNHTNEVLSFVPYIKTKLFYYQVATAGLVGSVLGVSASDISNAINHFVPAENRIRWIKVLEKDVLFDGDVTNSGRLIALSEHDYPTSLLLIHSFNFGEGDTGLQIDGLMQALSSFTEVRFLDTPENREIVSRCSFEKVSFSLQYELFAGLEYFEFRVFHFAMYYRLHKDMQHLVDFIRS